jgi:hypothetical protein
VKKVFGNGARMRSALVLLRDTTSKEVARYLDAVYPSQREPWIALVSDDPCLYINLLQGSPFDEDEREEMIARFDGEPAVTVVADVSGRHPGDEQIFELTSDLLGRFSGAALDDYTSHLWTLEELKRRHLVDGHPFFDYQGWFEERRRFDG